ncbi:MAG: GNAT family N-acetyltransferase, partial [Bdellovibrionota bacterium]
MKPAGAEKLSNRIWGVQWAEHFPMQLGDSGCTVELSGYDRVTGFLRAHWSEVFPDPGETPFLMMESSPGRDRFYEFAADCFLFRVEDRVAGAFIGNPTDWSTYYVRSASVLPEFQGRHIYSEFLPRFESILAALGVDRVEA